MNRQMRGHANNNVKFCFLPREYSLSVKISYGIIKVVLNSLCLSHSIRYFYMNYCCFFIIFSSFFVGWLIFCFLATEYSYFHFWAFPFLHLFQLFSFCDSCFPCFIFWFPFGSWGVLGAFWGGLGPTWAQRQTYFGSHLGPFWTELVPGI